MKLSSGDKLLDLGCGAGRHAIEFDIFSDSKVGIEDIEMLVIAEKS